MGEIKLSLGPGGFRAAFGNNTAQFTQSIPTTFRSELAFLPHPSFEPHPSPPYRLAQARLPYIFSRQGNYDTYIILKSINVFVCFYSDPANIALLVLSAGCQKSKL